MTEFLLSKNKPETFTGSLKFSFLPIYFVKHMVVCFVLLHLNNLKDISQDLFVFCIY